MARAVIETNKISWFYRQQLEGNLNFRPFKIEIIGGGLTM